MKKFRSCIQVQCYPQVLSYEQQQPLFQKAYVEYQQCAGTPLQTIEQSTYNSDNVNAAFISCEDKITDILDQCAKNTHMYLDEIDSLKQCQLSCLDQTVKSLITSASAMSIWSIIFTSILSITLAGIGIFYMLYRYQKRKQLQKLSRIEQLTKSSEQSNIEQDKLSIIDCGYSQRSNTKQEKQQRIIIPQRNKKKQYYKPNLGGLSRLDLNKMKKIVDHLKIAHPTVETVDTEQASQGQLVQKVEDQSSCLCSSNTKDNCQTVINITPNCANSAAEKHSEITAQIEHKNEDNRIIQAENVKFKRKRHFSVTQSDRSSWNMSQNINPNSLMLTEKHHDESRQFVPPESEFKENSQFQYYPELRKRKDSNITNDQLSSRLSDHLNGSISPSLFLQDVNSNLVVYSPNSSGNTDDNYSSTQLNKSQSSSRRIKTLKFQSCNNSSMFSPKSKFALGNSPDHKKSLLFKKKSFDFPAFEYQSIKNEKDKQLRLEKVKNSKTTLIEEQDMVSRIRGELLANEPRDIQSKTGSFQQFITNPIISQQKLDSSIDSGLFKGSATQRESKHADQNINQQNKPLSMIDIHLAAQSNGVKLQDI